MTQTTLLSAILDSLKDPILFADTEHITRYMNKAAVAHYREGEGLIGRSLLECHNEHSQKRIQEILTAMKVSGLEEELIADDDRRRVYMRAVRDNRGEVLGYYERYEWKEGER
ncbi:MAG: PAS domain-containing protein [Anaerolineae bacterium]